MLEALREALQPQAAQQQQQQLHPLLNTFCD